MISSFVIGGLVLVSFGRFSTDVSRDLYMDTLDSAVHGNLGELVLIIEYDFSRIGLGVNDPEQPVLINADSTDLSFYLDSNGDGTLETMRYYLGDSTSAVATGNPRDKLLYRVVNGGAAEEISSGLTEFKIEYYDANGNQTADLSQINTFVVSLSIESGVIYDDEYPRMHWQGRITPPNLVTH